MMEKKVGTIENLHRRISAFYRLPRLSLILIHYGGAGLLACFRFRELP
jgi:hypothetical protein